MTAKKQLLQEIEQAPEELIQEVLSFLESIKTQSHGVIPVQNIPFKDPDISTSSTDGSKGGSLLSLFNEFEQMAQRISDHGIDDLPYSSSSNR